MLTERHDVEIRHGLPTGHRHAIEPGVVRALQILQK